MRALRLLAAGLAALLVLALLAAAFGPGLLDWSRYRGRIALLASAALGQSVRIDGAVGLRLLPQPELMAAGGRMDGGAHGLSVAARELRLRVALGPLLGGRIDARELVLRGVDLRLPWPLTPDTLALRRPPWLAALSARIEDGVLRIGTLRVSGIEAALTLGAAPGEVAAAGAARVDGRPWRFDARLSGIGRDGSAALSLALSGEAAARGTRLAFAGQIAPDRSLAGRLLAFGPDLSLLLPAPALPFRAEGRLSLAEGLAVADDLALQLGGRAARAALALRLAPVPRLDLSLAASRIGLDVWLPVLLHGEGLTWPVGLDISAEEASLAGRSLRRLRATFELGPDAVQLRMFTADLPGEARLGLSGTLTRGAAVRFVGTASLAAPALRSTLGELAGADGLPPGLLAGLPPAVLGRATLTAELLATPGTLRFTGLAGTLDDSTLAGTLALRIGARPDIDADLTLDALALDPWMPATRADALRIGAALRAADVDLRLRIARASLAGQAIVGLRLDAAATAGVLRLAQLQASVGGVQAALSGTLGADGGITDGRLAVSTPDATPLAALLPPGWRGSPALWQGPGRLQVRASGPPAALALQLDADLADAHLSAQPVLDLPAGSWRGPLTLRHPGAPRLLRALGLDTARGWVGEGSLSLIAVLSGRPGALVAESFEISAGLLHATGALSLVQGRLGGHLDAETLPLPYPDLRSNQPLPFASLAGWGGVVQLRAAHVLVGASVVAEQASGMLALDGSVLRVQGIAAQLAGGRLGGAATIDAGAQPPRLHAALDVTGATIGRKLTGLPVDLLGGRADGGFDLRASGYSAATLLATLAGEARLAARDGRIGGLGLPDGGAFQSLDLEAHLAGGVLNLPAGRIQTANGAAALSGSLDLPDSTMNLRFRLHPAQPGAPAAALQLIGPLAAPQRLPELLPP